VPIRWARSSSLCKRGVGASGACSCPGAEANRGAGRRPLVVLCGPAPRGVIQPGGVKGPTSGCRNGRGKLRGSLIPEVRWRAGAAPDDRATVRRQRAGCGSKAERRRRRTSTGRQPRNWRLWAVGMLGPVARLGPSCPPVSCSGGRGRVECCGSARRCPRGTAGRRPCRPVDSERGKRPGGARRTRCLGSGAGAPSAVAAGAWRRTRSSRGSNDPPGRAGKSSTGRRGPVSTQHDSDGRSSPVNTGAPLSYGSGYSAFNASCTSGHPLDVLMESRMRGDSQVRFGGQRRGNHRLQSRHQRLAADPAPRIVQAGRLLARVTGSRRASRRPRSWIRERRRSRRRLDSPQRPRECSLPTPCVWTTNAADRRQLVRSCCRGDAIARSA
jgi:hypothetical protein